MIEAVVIIGLALGVYVFTIFRSAGRIVREDNAIEINGENYSVADVNYFYYAYYDSYCEQNADYLSYMFDQSRSLKEQEYEDGESWFSYFLEESLESLIHVAVISEEAEKQGYKLGEESQQEILDYLDGISFVAESSELTADAYAARIYGDGMTLERLQELMTMAAVARDYTTEKQEGFTSSDEELEQYFEAHREYYEFADYERLYFKAGTGNGEPSGEERSQAEALAREALEKVQSGRELKDVADEYQDAVYYTTEDAYYSTGYAYGDWLFLEERENGDSEIIDDQNGFYVLVFHGRSRHEYPTVNVRDICFAVDTAAKNLDEEYEESCEKAEELLERWKAGGGTEALFAELAEETAGDSGHEGGLYENVRKDSVDAYVEKWCFDPARKAGDCEVIYTEKGFHVLYFAGYGRTAWKVETEEDIRESKLQDWLTELTESVQVKRNEKALERAADAIS